MNWRRASLGDVVTRLKQLEGSIGDDKITDSLSEILIDLESSLSRASSKLSQIVSLAESEIPDTNDAEEVLEHIRVIAEALSEEL